MWTMLSLHEISTTVFQAGHQHTHIQVRSNYRFLPFHLAETVWYPKQSSFWTLLNYFTKVDWDLESSVTHKSKHLLETA